MPIRKIEVTILTLLFTSLVFSKNLNPIMISDLKTSGQYCAKIIFTNLIKNSKNKAISINRLDVAIGNLENQTVRKDIQRNKITFASQYELPVDYTLSSDNYFSFSLPRIFLPSDSKEKIHNVRKMNFEKMSCGNIYFITLLNGSTQNEVSLKAIINHVSFDSQSDLKYLSSEIKKSHAKLQGQSLKSILIENPFLMTKSLLNIKVKPEDLNNVVTGPQKLRDTLSAHINRIHEFTKLYWR